MTDNFAPCRTARADAALHHCNCDIRIVGGTDLLTAYHLVK
jgi:hypothetical protein